MERSKIGNQSNQDLPARELRSLRFQGVFRARAALSSAAQPHRVHKTAGKARMAPEVMAQLALDRSTLGRASAPSNRCGRELAPFLDALEKRFAGRDGRENERHAVGNRRFDKS